MIWFDGKEWKVNKYEITYTTQVYGDNTEGYPEDTVVKEIVLTDEQQNRLEEIQGIEFDASQAISYVRDGIGEIPDNRSTEDKLIDKIIELNPDAISDIAEAIKEWTTGQEYSRNVYVRFEGVVYKTIHPIRFYEIGTPSERSDLYTRIGKQVDDGTIQAEEFRQPTGAHDAYNKGDRVLFNGKVYESLMDANTWSPDAYPQGWKVVE